MQGRSASNPVNDFIAASQTSFGRVAHAYMEFRLEKIKTAIVAAASSEVPKLQGRAQELIDIMRAIESGAKNANSA